MIMRWISNRVAVMIWMGSVTGFCGDCGSDNDDDNSCSIIKENYLNCAHQDVFMLCFEFWCMP
jgi:hypothetical protein